MKHAWLFARCGVTGLALDGADLFLLLLQTFHERNQFKRQFLWRVASSPWLPAIAVCIACKIAFGLTACSPVPSCGPQVIQVS